MADGQSKPAGVLGHLPPWPRKPLNNSVIAMEQAYRQRKGLPGLNDAEVEALKAGVPMPWEGGGGGGGGTPKRCFRRDDGHSQGAARLLSQVEQVFSSSGAGAEKAQRAAAA